MIAGLALALTLSAPVPLPRPVAPPAAIARQVSAPERTGAADPVPIPLPRPVQPAAAAALPAAGEDAEAPASAAGVPRPAPRPATRPARQPEAGAPVVQAMLALPGGVVPRDMVCRDPRIGGRAGASFVGGIPGCGIVDPVRVASIGGIRLSIPATLDCRTARKFADWLTGIAQPAARQTLGSSIVAVRIMGSYACRTRNNSPGERLSEHSVGRAVDVGGVRLADGRRIRVLEDWGRGAPGVFLRRVWQGACGGFATVIGPDGDSRHRDHLHLDAAYRDGAWCE